MTPDERAAVRELLDAEEACRMAPTMEHTSRLARARRRAEQLLAEQPEPADG